MNKSVKDYFFVSIQFFLFGLYAFDFLPKMEYPKPIAIIGVLMAILGFVIMAIALFELKTNLTVFPTPKTNSELITFGMYKFSRHPIYSGILLFVYGYAIFSFSLYKLLISSLLFVLLYFKTNYEESQLERKFPDYSNYKMKVGRFFPKIK